MCARSAPRTRATPWPPSLTTATSSTSTPGVGVLSTIPGGDTDTYDGTSMATPHIAGLGAYLLGTGAATAAGMCEYIAGLALEGVLGGVPSGTANLLTQERRGLNCWRVISWEREGSCPVKGRQAIVSNVRWKGHCKCRLRTKGSRLGAIGRHSGSKVRMSLEEREFVVCSKGLTYYNKLLASSRSRRNQLLRRFCI